MLLICIIDTKELKDIAVIDIPNNSIKTQIEYEKDMAIINIRRILVEMLLYIAPDVYGTYVTTDMKGIKQRITQCMNSIYGTMLASLM